MSVLRFYGTKSDRHAYLRFKAGLVYHYGQRVRFLTLTGLRDDYRRAFKLLREWVHSGGFYGPPECCCDPVYMISNVEAAAAIRALIETTNKEK